MKDDLSHLQQRGHTRRRTTCWAARYCTILFLLSLPLSPNQACSAPIEKKTHPNIVFILVDDMGYGDPRQFNADSKIEMPNIERLAAEGMIFTDAHASGPLCHVSRYGLLTGCYPFRSSPIAWNKGPTIKSDQETIASLLTDAGYSTAMVGKWHLGFEENGFENPLLGGPVDRGFQSFFGIRASTDIPPYFYIRNNKAVQPPTETIAANASNSWSPIQGAFWRAGGIAPDLKLKDVLPRFTNEAVKVIDDHGAGTRKKPLMLYLAYPAPHTPWLPSKQFTGKSKVGMYGDFVMMVDAMIGRVLASLDRNGLTENTLLFFSSDNGPVWYESDRERFGHSSVGELRGMKADAWEGGHRMPFIARWPTTIEPGTSSDQMISFCDLLATFADLVGTELPHDAGPDSFSFLPLLFGEDKEIRPSLAVEAGQKHMSFRLDDWKLITGKGSGGFSKRGQPTQPAGPAGQLYNLAEDIGEQNNLYDKHPEIVQRLTAMLENVKETGRTRK